MRRCLQIVDDHRIFGRGLEAVFAAEPDFESLAISNPDHVLSFMTT